jgi:nicotinate-nucleotide pyrophosphorylase (carboxylating)
MEIPYGVRSLIRRALQEDIGPGDITTALLVPEESESKARFLAKCDFILAGLPFALEVFRILDSSVMLTAYLNEGAEVKKGDMLAEVSGKTRTILAGERVSLNILQRLCGIATLTRKYIDRIHGTGAKVLDTRKTTPCLRYLEKYAVRTGGGTNHRFGLFDGVLIKDNHIRASGGIGKAVKKARQAHHLLKIEVEVSTLQGLEEAISAGADVVLLDNMALGEIKKAVRIAGKKVLLEASGMVSLDNIREIAESGIDFISAGALTHSAPAADISLKIA